MRGNIILVDSKYALYRNVTPRRHRLRVVHASNQRFFRLKLSDGRPLVQIGTDLGLLAAPVERNELLRAPAERADRIADFGTAAGQQLTLDNEKSAILQFRVSYDDAGTRPAGAIPQQLASIEAPDT